MSSKSASSEAVLGAVPGPSGCTNFKLRQLTRRVSGFCEPFFADSGLTTAQYALLSHVLKLGPIAPGQLARKMDLDASTLSRNLQALLEAGLVEMGPGDDNRSRLLSATPAGAALRRQVQASWKKAQRALNERLGEARVQQLHQLLDECLALMRQEAPDA
ncbi:MarR family winged helix-turn-helix transcriptional regulator [Pelomonas sp. CA6]|uniref:MarR family winged helix-turn-helix transcriptional regulator n=1 Tax=Pelomonas sp. CA6 TaxID=2907999 RepID=UPI001F4BEA78|nr:MarR family winged helix-turn-helix transcriptional regulator [Pelomonas sp. CA6]MCH7345595.1 MarR family winged helix-turn-helix transcriptional regulator [Pelomonas sp. CA6]